MPEEAVPDVLIQRIIRKIRINRNVTRPVSSICETRVGELAAELGFADALGVDHVADEMQLLVGGEPAGWNIFGH